MENIVRSIVYFTLFISCINHVAAADKSLFYTHIKNPYSAEMYSYNKFNPKKIHKSKVVISNKGIRVESKGMFIDETKGLYIQNFSSNQSWVVDPKNKIFSLLKEHQQENDTKPNEGMGGIMSSRPCLGMDESEKKIEGEAMIDNEKVIIWSCNEKIKQGYSQHWNSVIWEELENGATSKLTNLKAVDFEEGFFSPSKNYREVSLAEFYTGAPTLKPYTP